MSVLNDLIKKSRVWQGLGSKKISGKGALGIICNDESPLYEKKLIYFLEFNCYE